MDPITLDLLEGVRQNGPTDPINYYRRPGVGALFRKRINLGLEMLPPRRFGRALEVGYGSGGLLLTLAKGVDDLHGLDLDAEPKSVAEMLAARGHHANLLQGTVHQLPYADGHFDLIVCFSVFEHLKDYNTALREVRRVLRPGGLFLLGMPAVNRLMSMMFEAIGHSTIDDIHITTPRMIRQAFAPSGFRVVRENPLNVPLAPPLGLSLYYNWLLERDDAGV
jgi:ubiquinone/menaquinone biosynthesis C-methylase UbiE